MYIDKLDVIVEKIIKYVLLLFVYFFYFLFLFFFAFSKSSQLLLKLGLGTLMRLIDSSKLPVGWRQPAPDSLSICPSHSVFPIPAQVSTSYLHMAVQLVRYVIWWVATISWRCAVHQCPRWTPTPAAFFSWDQPSCLKPFVAFPQHTCQRTSNPLYFLVCICDVSVVYLTISSF